MKAKKSLGQHWLIDPKVTALMLAAGPVGPEDLVLEIGPGTGVLTTELLKVAKQVIAIEKDQKLIEVLRQKFAHEIETKKLILIAGDALDFKPNTYNLAPHTYKIVANIPYFLTGLLLRKFLTHHNQPQQIIVMIQNEVGERVVTTNNKESLLSISVKVFGTPRYVARVPASAFQPAPKVDSCILAIDNISRARLQTTAEEKFFDLLKRGFAHKRKKLISNLGLPNEQFQNCGLDPQIRAEALQLADWLCLTKQLSSV